MLRKKSALDSLTALEKCFATLRDKYAHHPPHEQDPVLNKLNRLFDERLTSANEELALLQQPGLQHPELTAMKEAVDQHRNQKIKYQRTFLKLKLQTLQKESVAAKHQIHSQYMQTVREIRDKSLEQINKEFYQVQRERRSCEGAIPDYIYAYSDKRSQQIAQQTAYNNEISVLSGITKYIGFPAAPMIRKARPEELEDDMRNMGVSSPPSLTTWDLLITCWLRLLYKLHKIYRIGLTICEGTSCPALRQLQLSLDIHRRWRSIFLNETLGRILSILHITSNGSTRTASYLSFHVHQHHQLLLLVRKVC